MGGEQGRKTENPYSNGGFNTMILLSVDSVDHDTIVGFIYLKTSHKSDYLN